MMSRAWCIKNKSEKPLDFKNKEETFASRYANGTGPFMLVSRVLSTCWIEDKFSP